jgi:hypothetical protein
MNNLNARFTSGTASTLTVSARTGKRNIRVVARFRTPGEKVQSGCKNLFGLEQEAEAMKKFDELRTDAIARGWVAKGVKTSFTTIPDAPKPVEAKPAEVPKLKKARKVA